MGEPTARNATAVASTHSSDDDLIHTCPFLGTGTDQGTAFAFASSRNRCYRHPQPQHVSLAHQSGYCLSRGYRHCPVLIQPDLLPPTDATQPENIATDAAPHETPGERATAVLSSLRERVETAVGKFALSRQHLLLLALLSFVLALILLLAQFSWPAASSAAMPAEQPALLPTPTLAPTAASAETATPAPCPVPPGWRRVTVQPDETLPDLAARANVTVEALMQANCLTTRGLIAGQSLYLPIFGIPEASQQLN